MYKSILSCLFLILLTIVPVHAANLLVPAQYPKIQDAINNSNNGDTVIVSPGTYFENIDFWSKNITVTSTNPEDWDVVAATIIDGNNTNRVVTFRNNEKKTAVLTGFTITGGVNYEGAGIYCYNASPTITRNIIMDNHGQVDFTNGLSTSYGGGIFCYYSDAIITRNIIKNNSAYYGGGIRSYYNEPLISNNVIIDNTAIYGGGAYIRYGGYFVNNTLNNNSSLYYTPTGTYSGSGANLYYRYYSYYDYEMEVSNNIITNGISYYGVYYYEDVPGSSKFYNNDVWGNESANYYNSSGGQSDLTGINGNISVDPLFIDEYHIGPNSPCRDAGDPFYVPYIWQKDIDGQYAVMDSAVDIGADEIPGNPRPVADAGQDQLFDEIPAIVMLDGTGSYDPCDEPISWYWLQTGGESVTLSNSDTSQPSFIPLVEDVYYFQLRVFDGNDYSQAATVMIVVGNRAPVADAGSDKFCQPLEQVTLSGSGSYDLDEGDTLSYSWTQVSGPPIQLSNSNSVIMSIKPSVVGEYVFQLIVSDGEAYSQPDTVTVICRIGSMPDAYGYSWIDSDNVFGPAYHWIDIQDARNSLTNLASNNGKVFGPIYMDFDFNFYGKSYNKFYIQSSGVISFGSSAIYYNDPIPSNDGYNNMIAWMWTDMELTSKSMVYYKTFTDYMVIEFVDWSFNSDYGTVNAEVILYKSGKIVIQYKDYSSTYNYLGYTIGIENSDGSIGSEVAYYDYGYVHSGLAIEFSLGGPYEPVAHAGPDQQHKVVELITLDGSGSNDRDPNYVLTYQWSQTGGTPVELSSTNTAVTTFMPASEGEYTFQLIVNDGTYSSYPDEVTVFIGNHAPIANAGTDKASKPGVQVSLNGSGSYDPDTSDTISSYTWTQVSGPSTVNISNSSSMNASFTPTVIGEYVFQLVVSDGVATSQPDTVSVFCTYGSLPDSYGYSWIDSDSAYGPVFHWIDIQNTGTQIPGIEYSYEETFGTFPLGFNFNFYGNVYNRFYIQSNGAITFGSQPSFPYDNRNIPKADSYNNMIAWFWAPMYPSLDSKIYYQHFDSYTIIQFVDYDIDYGGSVNAEVILYESGRIVVQYADFSEDAYMYMHTVGIENIDGTAGLQVSYDTSNYPHDNLAIEFSFGSPYEPIANAGANQYVRTLSLVTLDGSGSLARDPAEALTYQWTQTGGPSVTLSNPGAMNPTFQPPAEAEYTFRLVVNNGGKTSYPDEVKIFVGNEAPIAVAGSNMVIQIPCTVLLDGTYSYDHDANDVLTYSWFQTEGPDVSLDHAGTATPSFYCDTEGVYKFMLIVNDGVDISDQAIITVKTATVSTNQQSMNYGYSTPEHFYYPSISGDKLVYCLGSGDDFTWDIYYDNLSTGSLFSFAAGGVDTQPKIDGDIVVWFGGMNLNDPWGHEPSNSSVVARNLVTGTQKTLRGYTTSSSYSHPAISGKKVVWLEHTGLDTTPIGSNNAANWNNTPYSICGADVSNLNSPNYFTIASNVGRRNPYPYQNYSTDFDDVIDIDQDIVVYEANGDIYGADISNIYDIKVFTICSNPARQYDPAISGNIVVWTDERNDSGDIYGADISDIDNIRGFYLVKAAGSQRQSDIDGHYMVYVDGDSANGDIKACFIAGQCALDIPLTGSPYGSSPVVNNKTVLWQTSTNDNIEALSLEFLYTAVDGPVENINSGKKYDYIQHAIDDSIEGDMIVVEPGTYYENINTYGKNLVIRSVDSNDPSVVESTILMGSKNKAVVTYADGQNVSSVLEGFTITGSDTGIYCEEFSSPTIYRCNIIENSLFGINLYRGCEPVITECRIMKNGNSGIKMKTLTESEPHYNMPVILNSVIAGNNLFGISEGKPVILNCTIANNMVCGMYNSSAVVTNSIIYFNGDGSSVMQVLGNNSTISYSDVQGILPGDTGNIASDPLFADILNGDFHLKSQTGRWDASAQSWVQDSSSSPCIDAGDTASDIGMEPAPNGSIINMGAYGGTIHASMSQ